MLGRAAKSVDTGSIPALEGAAPAKSAQGRNSAALRLPRLFVGAVGRFWEFVTYYA